jgi:hypothetical protein
VAVISASVEDGSAKGIDGKATTRPSRPVRSICSHAPAPPGASRLHQGRQHRSLRPVRRLGEPRSQRAPARRGRAGEDSGRRASRPTIGRAAGAVYVFSLTREAAR